MKSIVSILFSAFAIALMAAQTFPSIGAQTNYATVGTPATNTDLFYGPVQSPGTNLVAPNIVIGASNSIACNFTMSNPITVFMLETTNLFDPMINWKVMELWQPPAHWTETMDGHAHYFRLAVKQGCKLWLETTNWTWVHPTNGLPD